MLAKMKLKTSSSFRATTKCFSIVSESLAIPCKAPSYTTLLNWIHKIGYYELNKIKEKADDWIIILDESIQLGCDKILVIFGIRESEIDFTRPLNFQDLVPLREISKTTWNGELIKDVVIDLKKEIGNITYAVGDYGSDLRKGLRLLNIPHIHDITHKIALILEKTFKNNTSYMEITQKMSEMRIKFSQSEIAHIIPPNQRKKSRYQNIKIISDWCMKALNLMESNQEKCEKIKDNLKWILSYKTFILELSEINQVINNVEKILKYNGLSVSSKEECNIILDRLTSEQGIQIKEQIQSHLIISLEMLPEKKKILVTSDIIESAFGKYKNYVSSNPMAGITNLALSIAAFTSSLDENEIKEALELTTMRDIKKWSAEFIGKTLLQKRREAFCPI